MSFRVETQRDDNGRLLKLTIYKGTAKKVQLQFDFAQDEFIDTITFSGRREELPSASEIVALISAKFMERVQTLGNIEDALPTGTNSIGQVTANAGTNLNTSLLALEAGGNLAAILARLDVALSTRALEAGGNLAALVAKDFATQTTLALIKAKTDNLDVLLSTRALEAGGNLAALVAKDYATQTTLALLKTRADLLATEATLGTVHGHVDSIDGKITACNTGAIAGSLTQSTKHDAKVYLFTASGSAADGATVISNVADKVIKIHRLFLQSAVDGATDVYFYEETSGNKVTTNTTLNAREGRESAFVPAPACIGQTTTVNKKVLLKNAAAKQVYWEVTYSVDDAA